MSNLDDLNGEQMRRVLRKVGEDSGGDKLDNWIEQVLEQPSSEMCNAVDLLHTMACTKHGDPEKCSYYGEETHPKPWTGGAHKYWLKRVEFIGGYTNLNPHNICSAIEEATKAFDVLMVGNLNWRVAKCLSLRIVVNARAAAMLRK